MSLLEIPSHVTHIFAPKRNDYCVIIGVLNEGDTFRRQITRMQPYRELLDIIIADGGSSDGASGVGALQNNVSALLIKTASGGLSAQYRIAFYYALQQGYKGIISMDGNGKDGVEALPDFVQALKDGFDLVQGSRFIEGGRHENTPLVRIIGIQCIFNPLMWLASGFPYTDGMNGFRACSERLLRDARMQPFRAVFNRYNLQYYLCYRTPKLGYSVKEIPVARLYPADGRIPTKIIGIRSYINIMKELLSVLLGLHNPPREP